ncbi:hypothetical protein HYPSUDRAFT_50313 [Hypholoma sublateritium FD-334 SS-4]|uniref:N-acetyltransferase domain-containing protein n=1 Tax=Hypholoma sublateritium (strain FD-334 SS-4) TaxID=945553 RepID=A0A0D2LP23_HYPSF|nr:hypothetical protein HYPSUDRAFT_50313 [Hypholoma sublateritium FD-334 SS-4]
MSEAPATPTPVPGAPAYEIVRARTPAEIQQCIDLRIAVFHTEQGFPLDTEVDAYDALPSTAHFLLRLASTGAPAGTIRATRPAGAPYYKLTRLAVHAAYRAHRLGAALARHLHAWALADARAAAGASARAEIVAHSQIPAMGFYAKYVLPPRPHRATPGMHVSR